jgi:ATP-dependent HslUV protease ATP-binding subunit HslU
VNERTENIGARRLHTVLERLLEEISFEGADNQTTDDGKISINAQYVNDHLENLAADEDLSRYIL